MDAPSKSVSAERKEGDTLRDDGEEHPFVGPSPFSGRSLMAERTVNASTYDLGTLPAAVDVHQASPSIPMTPPDAHAPHTVSPQHLQYTPWHLAHTPPQAVWQHDYYSPQKAPHGYPYGSWPSGHPWYGELYAEYSVPTTPAWQAAVDPHYRPRMYDGYVPGTQYGPVVVSHEHSGSSGIELCEAVERTCSVATEQEMKIAQLTAQRDAAERGFRDAVELIEAVQSYAEDALRRFASCKP
ncbi:hypothetical protein BV25DRAFT_1897508 [Artomyces pyxidatus]|uniref:Uncharacterized protein n=1 Tax=Artomyces pyxidatus TaxID=48021 RepID=A0ACB8TE13_9AGAM|nr:hypothetical protein BV25DRAFT_1897508 [Artomyces pyxidatus]